MMYYPTFPFVRAMYILIDTCTWEKCYGDYSSPIDEFKEMEFRLLGLAFVYFILALYLNEVLPQTYGVPKHPLYMFEDFMKKNTPGLYNICFGDESKLQAYKDKNELKDEDIDVSNEREAVYNLARSEYWTHPLIVKDIRKVYPGVNGRPPKVANSNICLKIAPGELFGLLGPNGAGKTTLITQLTGLYAPTLGNAWIGGYDIRYQLELVQL